MLHLSIFIGLIGCSSSFELAPNSPLNSSDTPTEFSLEITDFTFNQNLPLGANFYNHMTSIDIDNDSDLDVIVTETRRNKISALINDGQGNFSLSYSLPASSSVYSNILTDDLNNDGFFDITVASTGGVINIWINDKNNSFQNRIDVSTTSINGGAINFISSGDIDNNGLIDILVANTSNNTEGSVSLLLNQNLNTVFTEVVLAQGTTPYGIKAIDIDKDNLPDLVLTSRNDDKIYIYKNENGTLSLTSQIQASIDPNGSKPTDIQAADLNKDGHIDLTWGTECSLGKIQCHKDNYEQNIYISYGASDLNFDMINTHHNKAYGDIRMLSLYDVNQDGYQDIISIDDINTFPFSTNGEYSTLSIFMNDQKGSFSDVQNKMLSKKIDENNIEIEPGSSYSNSFVMGDFNSDGLTDFVADAKLNGANRSSGVRVYLGRIKSQFTGL